MHNKILWLTLAAVFTAGSAQAGTITNDDFFGTFGDTENLSTDIIQTLSVGLFGDTAEAGAGATLTNVKVELRGSLSTEGTFTNNGTEATVAALILAFGGNWEAIEQSGSGLTDVVFATAISAIISDNLGTIAAGASGTFGVTTNDSGWLTLFDGANAFFGGSGNLDYLFTTDTLSSIDGSTNFESTFTTASAGGLRVTYTFDEAQPPIIPVPEPTALVLMAIGLTGFGFSRRKAK